MQYKILTVSSANMDLNMRVKEAPVKGQTVFGRDYCYVPGGKGANSAVAVAKLGGSSYFCASLGNDSNGKALLNFYKSLSVRTDYISFSSDRPTGLATVTVEDDGANRITVFSGANLSLSPVIAADAFGKACPDAVLCHFEIPFETVTHLSRLCYEAGVPMFIDAGPADKNINLRALSPVCVFSPNETETEIFTGISPDTEKNCVAAVNKLKSMVAAKYYVIKLGKRGAAVSDGTSLELFPAYCVPVKDTTAAGDSFTAALTLEYVRSGSIEKACRFGNAVAAVTVSRTGAGESVPTDAELNKFLTERNIKF